MGAGDEAKADIVRSDIFKISERPLWSGTSTSESAESRPSPEPTRDLAILKADLDAHGYCLIAEALSNQHVQALRTRLDEQWDAEARAGVRLINPTGVHSVCNLLNKGEIFQRIVLHPIADELIKHLLGDDFLISALCGNTTVPGSLAQGLHIDQFLFGVPPAVSLVANAFFMLDDFTEENGATRIIPGSHRWSPAQLADVYEGLGVSGHGIGENPPGTIPAEGPAGTCFVFDGRLMHGAGKNRSTDRKRAGISSYYCRPWMRPFENPFLSISDDVMATLPPALWVQLGYKPWGLAGGYQAPGAPAPLGVVKPADQIREMV
jgi:ectoine hydroxylase-related dioxygenase (phytanoyl-CoA dioxygenase family)